MNSSELDLTSLTAEIVASYVTHNVLSAEKLADFIGSVHQALNKAATQDAEEPKAELIPAVPVKKSVTQDYLVCLEDGKKFKSLKRHLKSCYDLSPEDYRAKWGLPRDYPMVAPSYAAARSDLAKTMGLGRRGGDGANGRTHPAASSAPAGKAAKTGTKRAKKAA